MTDFIKDFFPLLFFNTILWWLCEPVGEDDSKRLPQASRRSLWNWCSGAGSFGFSRTLFTSSPVCFLLLTPLFLWLLITIIFILTFYSQQANSMLNSEMLVIKAKSEILFQKIIKISHLIFIHIHVEESYKNHFRGIWFFHHIYFGHLDIIKGKFCKCYSFNSQKIFRCFT